MIWISMVSRGCMVNASFTMVAFKLPPSVFY